jgi:hypothetical protein
MRERLIITMTEEQSAAERCRQETGEAFWPHGVVGDVQFFEGTDATACDGDAQAAHALGPDVVVAEVEGAQRG